MSDAIDIEAGERGRLRLFTVSLDADALHTLAADYATDPERPLLPAARALLNQPALDLAHVELFDIDDLAGLGLPGYLVTAHDIADAAVAPLEPRLEALSGFALLLLSEALPTPLRLEPDPALHLVATFETPQAEISMKRLTSDTGRGSLAPSQAAPRPEGRKAPRGAMIVLALVAAVLLLWAGSILLR